MKRPATYKQIIQYVYKNEGYTIQTCIIAAVFREMGYAVGKAWNSGSAKKPKVPTERDRKAIKRAVDHFTNQNEQ